MSDAADEGELQRRFLDAQLRGARDEALALLVDEGLGRGVQPLVLLERVLQVSQREIGRMWQSGEVSVAQEHMATAIAHLALSHLLTSAKREPRNGRVVVVACVEGEHHEFPARLVADALELTGFTVRYLGANVPTDSLVALVEQRAPDLVALSATMSFHVPALRAAVARLRHRFGTDLKLAVGGAALDANEPLAPGLEVDLVGTSATELVDSARTLLGISG